MLIFIHYRKWLIAVTYILTKHPFLQRVVFLLPLRKGWAPSLEVFFWLHDIFSLLRFEKGKNVMFFVRKVGDRISTFLRKKYLAFVLKLTIALGAKKKKGLRRTAETWNSFYCLFFCLVCTSSFFVYVCEKSKLCRGLLDCSNALVIKAVQFTNSLHSLCQAYIEYCDTCQCFILNSITLLANFHSMCKKFQM